MIENGCAVPTLKHTDYDFHRSFGTVGDLPTFPPEYNTDSGLGMPDQNADGQPYGCTNYSQASLATDLTGKRHDPEQLESLTHANQRGGYNIRDSLDAARKLGWFGWYFNIQAYAPLDAFDAMRYAQLVGFPEIRSITVGTPWFPSWETAALRREAVMPMPTFQELEAIRANPNAFGWHNHKLAGWKQVNGQPMFKDKSWQGTNVGDNGWLYFPRDVINVVMSLKWTVAYTPTMLITPTFARISLPLIDYIRSFVRNFSLSLRY
jgi:hypothetical protein